ncbi:MAG: GAF domain-containing protein [Proteobacteria bacterium]|nr:GAF domain-containing protein [Pseudomonadota bacterium]
MTEGNDILAAENARLKLDVVRLAAELEKSREKNLDAEQSSRAMLFMLEDMEKSREETEMSRGEWEATFDSINDPIFIHDKAMRLVRVNKAYLAASGEPKFKHVIGKPYYEVFPRNDGPLPGCLRLRENAEEEVIVGNVIYRSRAFPIHDKQGVYLYSVHTLEDITEKHQAEAAIQHANRALATLGAVNRSLVHATDEDTLLNQICEAIVRQRGYQLAWVGYVQFDENKSLRIMAHASNNGGYPATMQPSWAENELGMIPCGRAVRSGQTQISQDIANDPHYLPWRDEAIKLGYLSSIALPLMDDGAVFGSLTVYSNEVHSFIPDEISLLEEMAGDLAFGVCTLHVRAERDLALEKNQAQLVQLQENLESTVRAIAYIVEVRDPYTAGHQNRVADLATAIAKQIGLPDEQVKGIHMAGIVHDLGKIQIPAEILSKPGKISDIEFSLIKTHSQAGYNLLKDIDFPWPIAQMVLQHHERLDGSGYPQGLKGDDILLEARILSVADVVEAMSSHRPYRPGLGIAPALDEITRGRGMHYDPQVVDACLTLFKEKQYAFPS